jgi:hypothetical protein
MVLQELTLCSTALQDDHVHVLGRLTALATQLLAAGTAHTFQNTHGCHASTSTQ